MENSETVILKVVAGTFKKFQIQGFDEDCNVMKLCKPRAYKQISLLYFQQNQRQGHYYL